ncbi:protoporphyrinogen/coproporphyrinogen oxidase [Candidatus Omnitrophota bacterium]
MKIALLGAGFTGLELGRKLKEAKKDFIILEKESQIGGICRTNRTGRFFWDFAVHAIYSRSEDAMNYFYSLPLDYQHSDRNVKIFHSGNSKKIYILEYPFEIGVKDLPGKDKLECIQGYVAARMKKNKNYSNLKEWIDNRLGSGIAKHFMDPYNKKIWNCDLSKISDKLVSIKIEPASIIEFISSIIGKRTVGRAYQAKFIYPKQGIQKLTDFTAKDIMDKIYLNSGVEKLNRCNNKWNIITSNGIHEAEAIISTIPLVHLLKIIDIEGIKKEYDVFNWNNTFFVMVGLKKGHDFRLINNCHWVFFKENEIFYRITLMHNFSSEFPPALIAEVTQKGDVLNMSENKITDRVIKDLVRLGIVKKRQIEETDIKLSHYTYPIPTVGLENVKKILRDELAKHNIFLLGRNGYWEYINMDGVVLSVQNFLAKNLQLL